jgi:hypothetical protein
MSKSNQQKKYVAVIWCKDPQLPGKRVAVWAVSLDEAKKKLESEHGEGTVYDLHNEEDADRPR